VAATLGDQQQGASTVVGQAGEHFLCLAPAPEMLGPALAAGRWIWPELLKVKVVPYQIEDGVSDARWRFLGAEFCRLPVRQGSPSVPGL
jgi:hypothetical protein